MTEPFKTSITALRAQIDDLDHELIAVLARRMELVGELSKLKRQEGRKVRDPEREHALLQDRTAHAAQLGLKGDLIEALFRSIMRASRELQAALQVELPVQTDPKTIALIGGLGGMGRCFSRLFRGLGHNVLIADQGTELSSVQAAARADVTVIAVPIAVTKHVIDEVGPHVPSHGLLMDLTSLKTAPLAQMLQATQASVVGTHPMFGPNVHTLQGQRVVLCHGRGDDWLSWLEQNLKAGGLVTTHASSDEHDRAMACVQVLTHFQTQVLGLTLAELGIPLEASLRFTSPAYLMELYVAARHFAQNPNLYGPIEMENPLTADVTAAFHAACERLRNVLLARDQLAFERMFQEVRNFFGAFSAEATEQAGYWIDRLVERS